MSGNKRKQHRTAEGRRLRLPVAVLIFLFLFLFIYVCVTTLLYVTNKRISSYEVQTGSLSRNTTYTGFILREETVYIANTSGAVSYYQPEGTKVKVGSSICLTDLSGSDSIVLSDTQEESIEPDYTSLTDTLTTFQKGMRSESFSDVYSFHEQLYSLSLDQRNADMSATLDALVAENPDNYQLSRAEKDGIISYHLDGKEGSSVDELSLEMIQNSGNPSEDLRKEESKSNGDPLYKIITSETWSVAFQLDEETYEYLLERDPYEVQLQINKDNTKLWGTLSIQEIDDTHVAIVTFDQGMVRFAADRYLSVTLLLENSSGLKIPKSAIVSKDFFVVPSDYLTTGGNSSAQGVLIADDHNSTATFTICDIYEQNEEDQTVCLSASALSDGTTLMKPESSEIYTIHDTKTLQGVYNINKGYAVFKQINILSENNEYCIIEEGTEYGVSNYDFIALDGSSVTEDAVIR